MGKIVFVDGSQGVGKSTLIDNVSRLTPTYVYKFPFSEYSSIFSLNNPPSLKGFQLGKDLATLYFLSKTYVNSLGLRVVDRGPMSTVYYSLTTGRMSLSEVEEFFKVIKNSCEVFTFVFILPKNLRKFNRLKNDGFDGLKEQEVDPERAISTIKSLSKKYHIPLKIFENDFNESIESNSHRFYQMLKEEL